MSANSTSDIARVTERIAAAVLEFCALPRQFHMSELNAYVESSVGTIAPHSAGRILRALRQAGKVNYRVLDRSNSLYEIVLPVPTQIEFPQFDDNPRQETEYPD
jgi:hypothetical protein